MVILGKVITWNTNEEYLTSVSNNYNDDADDNNDNNN